MYAQGSCGVEADADFTMHPHVSTHVFVLYTSCPIKFNELHIAPTIIVPRFYSSGVWGKRSLAYLGAILNPINTNRFAGNISIDPLDPMLISPGIGRSVFRWGIVAT